MINYFENHYELTVNIDNINVKFPNKLSIEGLYIPEENGDTLLYSDQILAKVSALKLRDKRIYISEVLLNNPDIRVQMDSTGRINFQYILDKFASEKQKKSSKKGFDIFCESFLFENAHLQFRDKPFTQTPGSFNSSDILAEGFTIRINDFQMHGDSIEMELNEFSFREKSGLTLENMSAYFFMTDTLFQINDLFVKTSHSMIHAPILELAILDTALNDIWNDMTFNIQIDSTLLSIEDAAYFAPDLSGMDQKIRMSAALSGKLSDIKLDKFDFAYGKDTRIKADLSINGLPIMEEAFIFGEVKELTASVRDAQSIYLPPFSEKRTLVLPENVQQLGSVHFKGDLVGMFNDLVANGRFSTKHGSIRTDLAMVSNFKEKSYKFNGDIAIESVELGKILADEETFGILDMSANLNGKVDSLGQYDVSMSSEISQVDFNQYPYSEINLSGRLTNKSFNGEIMVNDPNLKVEFMGGYIIENKIPDVDFRADIKANLDELKLDSVDSEAGLILYADAHGNDLNNAVGELQMSNIYYRKENEKIRINQLLISSLNNLEEQILSIESDYFKINTNGYYDTGDLASSLASLIYHYFPILNKGEENKDWIAESPGIVNIQASFFNLKPITDFFIPQLEIPGSIRMMGVLDANKDNYNLQVEIPDFFMDTLTGKNIEIELSGNSDIMDFNIDADYLSFKNNKVFENLRLQTSSQNDSIDIDFTWDNRDTIRYYGDLKASVHFDQTENNQMGVGLHLYPSDFILRNEEWKLDEAQIRMDSSEINLGRVRFYNNDQMIRLVGDISNDPTKDLRYYVQNFDISIFNRFLEQRGFILKGIFNSNGRLADAYKNINFRSFVEFNDLQINKEEFGRLQINATWDYLSNALKLDGNSRFIDFRGFVNPTTDSLDISLNINNFGLSVVEPYLIDAGLLYVDGKLDGSIDVTGALSSPEIEGALDFDRAGLTYDMLMARFNLDDSIFVYTDSLVFKNFLISDENGGTGVIQGKLTHNMFKNIEYDFNINLDNYHIMNTTEVDNPQYYGSAFTTAKAQIYGGTDNITINIPEVVTEKNTVFVLPMSNTYDADDEPWITFLQDSTGETSIEDLIPKTPFDATFLMNLRVTPDAEARLVFDPKVGDMIRANCLGDLSIEVYPDGLFSMKGDLEIQGGDYLFTLQNIINKRFVIEQGGTISWDGDPVDGTLDLKAAYRLSAPLYDIMVGIDTSDVYKRPTDVSCIMNMSGSLLNPDIKFGIEVPNTDEKAKTRVASLSDDEINKQVLTLLVLNRFYTPDDMQMAGQNRSSNVVGVTSFEMLSNQVSNWLSQISDDFDIGVNYRPGDEITSDELEVALSTQILNDRVLINGNVGYGQHESMNSDIVGDVEVQVKMNKSGNIRVKGFTRANSQSQMEYDYGPYTQGVGLFYTESFNTLRDLLKRYFASGKNKDAIETKSTELPKTDSSDTENEKN